ncbi:MAG: MBL fold metallo-hydrolase, partial [Actinomycetota bacterium]
LQFDVGRGTVLRLSEAAAPIPDLTAVFVTHIHSDHLVGLPDLALTRWVMHHHHGCGPLTVVCPENECADFVRTMLSPYAADVAVRMEHFHPEPPSVDLFTFPVPGRATTVWTSEDEAVRVDAVAVHHEPVTGAVAYRVTTPTAVVVISGDTRVCAEVEELARDADVLVHEACRRTALRDAIAGTAYETIFDYHADTVALGGLAQRAGVGHLVLTHLIPPPRNDRDAHGFAEDVRSGGYEGRLTVGEDLFSVEIGPAA